MSRMEWATSAGQEWGRFSTFIYVDDAILVGNAFGSRLSGSVEAWEWACDRILNEWGRESSQSRPRRSMGAKVMAIGFLVDTEANWISAHEPQIVDAENLIHPDEFAPANTLMRLKTLQKLRGPCRSWSGVSSFWKVTLQTIDILLGYADERGDDTMW